MMPLSVQTIGQPSRWLAAGLLALPLLMAPLTAHAVPAESVMSGSSVVREGANLAHVSAGDSVQLIQCQVGGAILAGRDVMLERCPEVGTVTAGRDIRLHSVQVNGPIQAGRQVSLQDATVRGSVVAGGGASLHKARIDGTLTLPLRPDAPLELRDAEIGAIRFTQTMGGVSNSVVVNGRVNNSIIAASGGSIVANGMTVIQNQGAGAQVRLGGSGVANINGYTLRRTDAGVTILTPDGSIYVEGKRVSGAGPKTYDDYRLANPSAPQVIDGLSKSATASNAKPAGAPQRVLLTGQSVIQGDITFEGGSDQFPAGVVEVEPGARLLGKVIGGQLKTVTR